MTLFTKNGYLKTSVSDIMQSLMLAKGSFYNNFYNKGALLLDVLDYLLKKHCLKLKNLAKEISEIIGYCFWLLD